MRNQSKNYNCDCFVISTNQVIKIRKAKQSQLKIITFFIPDSDCGVLKKSDEMEMSSLGLVEICIFFSTEKSF